MESLRSAFPPVPPLPVPTQPVTVDLPRVLNEDKRVMVIKLPPGGIRLNDVRKVVYDLLGLAWDWDGTIFAAAQAIPTLNDMIVYGREGCA